MVRMTVSKILKQPFLLIALVIIAVVVLGGVRILYYIKSPDVLFLADRIGASFQGRISGVTRAGLFVKLDQTGADGLIPIRTLGTEYFNYDETRHALVGSRSGAMHRLGDVVDVRLVEAAPVAGALRFELLSEGQVLPRGRKRDGSHPSTKPSKARPGRSPNDKAGPPGKGKPGKGKSGKFKSGKSKPGKSKPGKSKRGKSW